MGMTTQHAVALTWCDDHQGWCPATEPLSSQGRELLRIIQAAHARMTLIENAGRVDSPRRHRFACRPSPRLQHSTTTRREAH